jgi:ABC-2 type transport system ATP-binding protein
VIELRDVAKSFGDKEAVRGVSFVIPPGEATGYLGPNGAGKSTTIKMIAGLLKPTSGEIRVCGFDVSLSPLEVKRRIGYVPEVAALYQTLTPNEYLSLVAELHHLDRYEAGERIREHLRKFELTEASDTAIEGLSKGMRQKVLIIGAVLHDPEVLLLDEPLNGLDVNAGLVFRRMLESMLAQGKTLLFSSHIFEVIERICSRVIIIDRGSVIADEPLESLLRGQPKGALESVFQRLTSRDSSGGQDADDAAGSPADTRSSANELNKINQASEARKRSKYRR